MPSRPSSTTWVFANRLQRRTLADANEMRDWRIYAEFAQHLIRIARRLYVNEPFGVDLKETVYTLDSTTIDLCLALFPWAPFRSTKAAIKLHTLIDLRGNIPSFIHIFRWQTARRQCLGCTVDRPGCLLCDGPRLSLFRTARTECTKQALSSSAVSLPQGTAALFARGGPLHGLDLRSNDHPGTAFYSKTGYPAPLRRIRFRTEEGKTLVFLTNNFALPALTITELYRCRWQVSRSSSGSSSICASNLSSALRRTRSRPRCGSR